MSDVMRAMPFAKLIDWVLNEYEANKTIFGIPESKFFQSNNSKSFEIFGSKLSLPIGPAAGPHTQLAQNIIAAYLSGSRFFELKTVQVLDSLEFPKPCILAEDECYNTEWSTELSITGAFEEYVKAWFILHILKKEMIVRDSGSFVFNMSVGYDLKGIQTSKVDNFIKGLKDASRTNIFQECRGILTDKVKRFRFVDEKYIKHISPYICNSITLSTMHGCPPEEIESICRYLLSEKKLHTFVKMNPTLLGYDFVKNTLYKMGYRYIELKEDSFSHDLQYDDGVAMLFRLKKFAEEHYKEFGIKLSNTLPVRITRNELPGEEMYMSGRSLYPLTVNLALKLAGEFNGDIPISFSGGADFFNVLAILETGIKPVTFATTLLKPGGYTRIRQIAEEIEAKAENPAGQKIDLERLKQVADSAFADQNHLKEKRQADGRKINKPLPLTDCFIAPCQAGCPIGQDIPEYIRLIGAGKYTEAYQLIVSRNPLPFITGEICDHKCMFKCTRLDYDDPVCIRDLKKIAAEKGYEKFAGRNSKPISQDSAKVAVIGAGPSGLAAGYFLAQEGLAVTIFDKRTTPGGTVEHVIPDFRISPEAIRNDIGMIKKTGVQFKLGVSEDFSLSRLKSEGYKYIYLAIGAGKSKAVDFAADSRNVMNAVPFLEEFKKDKSKLQLGQNIAVVGGGNTAMDTARAAKRLDGVNRVFVIYRRTKEDMPAAKEEIQLALEEGAILKELLNPVSFMNGMLKCRKMTLGEPDASGRRRPLPLEGEFEEIAIDTVLSAIGEQVDLELLVKNGIAVDKAGNIEVNPETLETNLKNVFIGGDVLSGPATVVEAVSHGRRAADAILAKENILPDHQTVLLIVNSIFDVKNRIDKIEEKKGRLKSALGAVEEETSRCLECDLVCNICTEVCPNRANIGIEVPGGSLNKKYQILHMDGMCNECGNCAAFCPYQGRPYQDKLTLFWEKEDFHNSKNPGFFLTDNGSEPTFQIRNNDTVSSVKFNSKGQPSMPMDQDVAQIIWTVFRKYGYLL